ncbi:MAG: hypothetical protein FWC50_02035 [Planctomycetaceae bacterium]|nr:hypothetical protein [Planctomycetaceae bacterium]
MAKRTSTIYLRAIRVDQGNPVSLFPFLAVLICTTGTLILLLVIITRNSRTEANGRQEAKAKEMIAQLQTEADSAEIMTQDLAVSKEQTIADIEDQRAKLAVLENSIEKTISDIRRTEKALQDLENNKGNNNAGLSELNKTLAEKKLQLQQAESELSDLQKRGDTQQKSYSVIPYRGLNGTNRRPIYIECRADCVVIQPEGVVLRENDFLTAPHPDNPLDAVLRSASVFYTENNLVPQGTRPYPLVLVRANGIDAYYAVRESIKSWGDQFGYELVENDWKLEFPKPNEELKQRLETQLQASRERMLPFKTMLLQREMATNGRADDYAGVDRGNNATAKVGGNFNAVHFAGQPQRRKKTVTYRARLGGGIEMIETENDSGKSLPIVQKDQTGQNIIARSGDAIQNMLPQNTQQNSLQQKTAMEKPPQTGWLQEAVQNPRIENAEQVNMNNRPFVPGEINGNIPKERNDSGKSEVMRDLPSHWAMPNVHRGSTEIIRPVVVQCGKDKIVFQRSGGRGVNREIAIPAPNGVPAIAPEFVKAVLDYTDTWGVAGPGMHWQPEITVTVQPGAERNFEELKILLNDSGVRIFKK